MRVLVILSGGVPTFSIGVSIASKSSLDSLGWMQMLLQRLILKTRKGALIEGTVEARVENLLAVLN